VGVQEVLGEPGNPIPGGIHRSNDRGRCIPAEAMLSAGPCTVTSCPRWSVTVIVPSSEAASASLVEVELQPATIRARVVKDARLISARDLRITDSPIHNKAWSTARTP